MAFPLRVLKMAMLAGMAAAVPLAWLERGRLGVSVVSALALVAAVGLPGLFARGGLAWTPALELLWLAPFFTCWGLGEGLAFFARVGWWDSLTHAIGGAMAFALSTAWARPRLRAKGAALALLGVGAALAAGALWEIGEFASDQLLGSHTQSGNLDTMADLIFDFAGGATTALAAAASRRLFAPERGARVESVGRRAHLERSPGAGVLARQTIRPEVKG